MLFPDDNSCLAAGLLVVPPLLLRARALLGVDGFGLDILKEDCTTVGFCCLPLERVLLAGKSALVLSAGSDFLAAIFFLDGEASSAVPLLEYSFLGVLAFWRISSWEMVYLSHFNHILTLMFVPFLLLFPQMLVMGWKLLNHFHFLNHSHCYCYYLFLLLPFSFWLSSIPQ
jgi:hypothetical protein